MATVLRIKRARDEEPNDIIVVQAKYLKSDAEKLSDITYLKRVATVNKEDEDFSSHIKTALQSDHRHYEKLQNQCRRPTVLSIREHARKSNKLSSKAGRYKIISKNRLGFLSEEHEMELDKLNVSVFDAMLHEGNHHHQESCDDITCNGIPMISEKDDCVYDLYFTSVPIEHSSWISNICEINNCEDIVSDLCSSDEEQYDDEDDENAENNWRNDYPDEDDSSENSDLDYESEMFHEKCNLRDSYDELCFVANRNSSEQSDEQEFDDLDYSESDHS